MGRILAIDFGLKRMGLALSDPMQIIASPIGNASTIKQILHIIAEKEVEKIIVGRPFRLSGEPGTLDEQVHEFVDELQDETKLPIELWDERLTSVQAERLLKDAGLSRKKRAAKVDTVAAVLILQAYLDWHRRAFKP